MIIGNISRSHILFKNIHRTVQQSKQIGRDEKKREEEENCLRMTLTMRRFWEIIDEFQLRDLPLTGGCFTWFGGLNNSSSSRLDRFLVSEDWESFFNGLCQSLPPKPTSDHAPILLDGGGIRGGKSPFCFKNMWLRVKGFKDLDRSWWMVTLSIDHIVTS